MLTCTLSGVNTFKKRQSSETFTGHTIFGKPQGTGCGHPGGSAVVWRTPDHGLGGLQGLRGSPWGFYARAEGDKTKQIRISLLHGALPSKAVHWRGSIRNWAEHLQTHTNATSHVINYKADPLYFYFYSELSQQKPDIYVTYLFNRNTRHTSLPSLTLCRCLESKCRNVK